MELKPNSQYEVLTTEGFKDFSGIKRTIGKTLDIEFSDGSSLSCTHNHLILTVDDFIEASQLSIGSKIHDHVEVVSIKDGKEEYVYDLLDVKDTNHYITNNVTSHNCAFVENWEDFYTSVYPTISSGKDTKMLFTSTTNGLNHFYKFYTESKAGRNGFAWIEVPWDRVPGRDEAWRIETLAGMNHNYEKFEQEFNNQFLGSSGTLVTGSVLKTLVHQTPIYEWDGFTQYAIPEKGNSYAMICDVSRGKGLDYSAFHIIDISKMPYQQVATYRSNAVTPTDYAHIINKIGTLYNYAHVLIEINDIGGQVADILWDDFEYENMLYTEGKGASGKTLCYNTGKSDIGIRTTTPVKAKGCSILKLLIEQQQLIINDFNTINELSRFSKKGKSYEAEDGNDDLVMGLVLFAWMTVQPYFADLTDARTIHNLRDLNTNMDEFVPFGFIVDGTEEDEVIIDNGKVWMQTEAWRANY